MSQTILLWEKLKMIRDEVALQGHLMNMEIQDEWQHLEKKCKQLEARLEPRFLNEIQTLGLAEEEFFVGDKNEISSLIDEFRTLDKKNNERF